MKKPKLLKTKRTIEDKLVVVKEESEDSEGIEEDESIDNSQALVSLNNIKETRKKAKTNSEAKKMQDFLILRPKTQIQIQ